jgi:putative ABC transport system ATP-binding protein
MADDPIIRLTDVRKSYGQGRGRQEVLRGVSMELRRGELVALVGQSGSGKSTLLNIIGGLDRADQGEVIIDGKSTAKLSDAALSRLRNERIGFIFQAFHLLDHLSCIENVALPAFFSGNAVGAEERAAESLARVGLGDLGRRRPTELSGGQKQRVAIARALFHKPAILLCDEPTGNLDSETGREVISFFQELNEKDGVTLLIVTHEERVSSAAKRVIRISDGKIATAHGADLSQEPAAQ